MSKQSKTSALEVTTPSELMALPDQKQIQRIMSDNLEGLTPTFPVVKIPAGGGTAFEIPTEGEDPDISQQVEGVILDHYRTRAYWPDKFNGQNDPPTCFSLDGIHGQGDPGGQCSECPLNEWGSGKDEKGNPSRGKACQERHRLFILPPGTIFPLLVSAPPTSIKNVSVFATKLSGRMKTFGSIITRLKLSTDKNAQGIKYSKLELFTAGDLNEDAQAKIKTLSESLKPAMRQKPIENIEVAIEPEPANDSF